MKKQNNMFRRRIIQATWWGPKADLMLDHLEVRGGETADYIAQRLIERAKNFFVLGQLKPGDLEIRNLFVAPE